MDRTKKGLAALVLSALAILFIVSWGIIGSAERRARLRDQPGWLSVEASPVAVVGRPFELRVTLEPFPGPESIVCGLRWTAADRRISGGLASAGPARMTRGGETLTFRVEVKPKKEMRFVSAVIYLSPTGRWRDRTRGASTELIPVKPEAHEGPAPPFRVLRTGRTSTPAEEAAEARREAGAHRTTGFHRALLVIVLLAAGVLCGARAARHAGRPARKGRLAGLTWAGFALTLVLFGALEAFDFPGRLTELVRLASMERDLYEMRRPIQGAAAVSAAFGAVVLVLFFVRAALRSRDHRWLWAAGIGVAVYLSLTLVGMTSFHTVDALRRAAVLGISPFHAARGAGAVLALAAAALALGNGRKSPHG